MLASRLNAGANSFAQMHLDSLQYGAKAPCSIEIEPTTSNNSGTGCLSYLNQLIFTQINFFTSFCWRHVSGMDV
jgi:hypothetical protein